MRGPKFIIFQYKAHKNLRKLELSHLATFNYSHALKTLYIALCKNVATTHESVSAI